MSVAIDERTSVHCGSSDPDAREASDKQVNERSYVVRAQKMQGACGD